GIRDRTVTGVQTCALPICGLRPGAQRSALEDRVAHRLYELVPRRERQRPPAVAVALAHLPPPRLRGLTAGLRAGRRLAGRNPSRSEERRVGKGGESRCWRR